MAYKRASNSCDGGNCNQLGSYIDWHVVKSIAISSDPKLMGIDGGFDGGFNGGSFNQFHLAVLGYQPQQSVRQLRREAFAAISREGLTGSLLNELISSRAIIIVTKPTYRG